MFVPVWFLVLCVFSQWTAGREHIVDRCSTYRLIDVNVNLSTSSAGWYRLLNSSTDLVFQQSCRNQSHCTYGYQVWMQGSLPAVVDGEVARIMCVNDGHSCCSRTNENLKVRNCSSFFIYFLFPMPTEFCLDFTRPPNTQNRTSSMGPTSTATNHATPLQTTTAVNHATPLQTSTAINHATPLQTTTAMNRATPLHTTQRTVTGNSNGLLSSRASYGRGWTTTKPDASAVSKNEKSVGMSVGISVGCVLVLLLAVILGYLFLRHRRKKRLQNKDKNYYEEASPTSEVVDNHAYMEIAEVN